MIVGRLDKRVRLQGPTQGRGLIGDPRPEYSEGTEVWASVDDLSGDELVQARAIEARATVQVRVRWFDGISPKWRVAYSGRILEVVHVKDWRSLHVEHLLTCREVVDGEE